VVPEALPRSGVQWLYNPDARTGLVVGSRVGGRHSHDHNADARALTLVRDREQGSWEGLLATSVSALDALIGKLAPYVVVAVAQAAIVIALARLLFDMPTLAA